MNCVVALIVVCAAGIERGSVSIRAAGGGRSTIRGPQGESAVWCDGAQLTLEGLAVEARGDSQYDSAVYCSGEGGRVTLRDCTLASPGGSGLSSLYGVAATMDGSVVAGCLTGVDCLGEGSSVTVRRPPQGHVLPAPRVFMAETQMNCFKRKPLCLPHCNSIFKKTSKNDCVLAAQMTRVAVERCAEHGIYARGGASAALTGCTLRHNVTDYRRDSGSSIVVDGSARPEGKS